MEYLNKYAASLAAVMAVLLMAVSAIALAPPVETSTTASVSVNEFVSITLSNDPVQFPAMDPGTGPTAANVNKGYPLTATLGEETNVAIDIGTKANGPNFCTDYATCAGNKFAIANMEWSPSAAGTYTDYSQINAEVCGNLGAGQSCNIYHQLTIPSVQAAGAYTTGITITASKKA